MSILAQLGISPSSAIQMLYSQIVLTRGLPLDLHLPQEKPTAIVGMSQAELDMELRKGVESLKSGKTYTADEVVTVIRIVYKGRDIAGITEFRTEES